MTIPISNLPHDHASNPSLTTLQDGFRTWSRSVGLRYTIPSGAVAVRQGDAPGEVLLLESGQALLRRLAGADGSSVCRILRALRSEGVITYSRGRIALLVR